MLFCCCNDVDKSPDLLLDHKLVTKSFQLNATSENQSPQENLTLFTQAASESHAPQGTLKSSTDSLATTAASSSSALAEDPARILLKKRVEDFQRSVVAGRTSQIVGKDPKNKAFVLCPAKIQLDKDNSHLSFAPDIPNASKATISCPLVGVYEIYVPEKDGNKAMPPAILACVPEPDRRNLLRLTFRPAPSKPSQSIYLLEASDNEREQFLEGMKVLCLAAKKKEKKIADAKT
mmetsp:Transcript_63194/g.133381  ORF Transcript_63194/g.133381 Transcript_63194/m.133381 type:complete len:234 (+) Transcript_63194:213-914(+)|eukprot:CAMPEP_0206536066 /NCGR_PEP_ID=MMETSP0325_2-20121206/6525_1 /ASSEMBLY_ACC=CAM_ASM_000347 /TAXON_ID=2866 /ORGANISM="Crypthecodinium cohnii, Strain Seligo" /LENGTH=233 /DNA_ID=CAMNT_0054033201 /DNA_START=109 /DNA_END=810 /DNA_ORIENTATION=-